MLGKNEKHVNVHALPPLNALPVIFNLVSLSMFMLSLFQQGLCKRETICYSLYFYRSIEALLLEVILKFTCLMSMLRGLVPVFGSEGMSHRHWYQSTQCHQN